MPSPRRIIPGQTAYSFQRIGPQKGDNSDVVKKQDGSSSLDNSKRQLKDDRPSPGTLINTPGLNGTYRVLSSDFFLQKDSVIQTADRRDSISRGQSIDRIIYPPHGSSNFPAYILGAGNTLVPVKFPEFDNSSIQKQNAHPHLTPFRPVQKKSPPNFGTGVLDDKVKFEQMMHDLLMQEDSEQNSSNDLPNLKPDQETGAQT